MGCLFGCAFSRGGREAKKAEALKKAAEAYERRGSELVEKADAAAAAASQKAAEKAAKKIRGLASRTRLRDATAESHPQFALGNGPCKVLSIYDGDTLRLAFAAPHHASWSCRLEGVDAEEMRQPRDMEASERKRRQALALRARNRLAALVTDVEGIEEDESAKGAEWDARIAANKKLIMCSVSGMDKYGRPLVTLRQIADKDDAPSINSQLIGGDVAIEYDGGKKEDVTLTIES